MTQPQGAQASLAQRVWRRACRFTLTKSRRSRRHLARLCEAWATDEYTLVIHSTDVDHNRYFPNAFVVANRRSRPADLHTDPHYRELSLIDDESFGVILCTGLLEHIPDPDRLVSEFRRILKPGGRLIVSASAVFPFHGAPDNYFHFTPNGFRLLFRDWSGFRVLRGSSRPFETVAILLQRINLQCDIVPPVRLFVEFLQHVLPALDVFVLRQYDSLGPRDRLTPAESFMPATVHAVVAK